jgi:hypothetical protein
MKLENTLFFLVNCIVYCFKISTGKINVCSTAFRYQLSCRSVKVKDGIIIYSLRNYLIDQYNFLRSFVNTASVNFFFENQMVVNFVYQ